MMNIRIYNIYFVTAVSQTKHVALQNKHGNIGTPEKISRLKIESRGLFKINEQRDEL